MMRRWLRSGDLPELGGWDLWRLREVGGWGDAARILGARWEEVGGAALIDRFGDRLIPLWRDRALGRWLGTLGVPNPDAVLVDDSAHVAVLRPIDLKWAIDTAEHEQISAETFARLLEKAGERLTARFPNQRTLGDGFFATPTRRLNRLYLQSKANRSDERPIEIDDLVEIEVDPPSFYAPLPGWGFAQRLAELEGTVGPAADVEKADRYFHLGVGVRGVLAATRRSTFDERPDTSDETLLRVDTALDQLVLARLGELVIELDEPTARSLVRRLNTAQVDRQALRQQLRTFERPSYRYGDYMRDVVGTRLPPALDEAERADELRLIYRDVSKAHAADVRARGRELVGSGLGDAEALERLRGEMRELTGQSRRRARLALRAYKKRLAG